MKVILQHDVPKLGKKYDVKTVADGHALNFLIPKNLAEVATEKALKKLESLKATVVAERKVQEDLLSKNIKSIEGVSITIAGKANDKGHLFAGIHKEQLIPELKKQAGIDVLADFIMLDAPIKEVGEHKVEIKVHEKTAKFTLTIVAA